MSAPTRLPRSFDAWLTTPPEPSPAYCAYCDGPLDGDPIWVRDAEDEKVVCSGECEAMWVLVQPESPAVRMAAAAYAYGEGAEPVLRLTLVAQGEAWPLLVTHVATAGRSWPAGWYMVEDLDGVERPVHVDAVGGVEVLP